MIMKPLNHNPRWIAKAGKAFKDIKLPVRIRNIYNIGVSVFGNKDKKKKSNLRLKKMLWRCWFIIDR